MKFKNLFILLLLNVLSIDSHGQSDSLKLDTVQLVILYSQCPLCSPQTDVGYGIFSNKGTKGNPQVEVYGYLNRDGLPIKENAIVWMFNIPKRKE